MTIIFLKSVVQSKTTYSKQSDSGEVTTDVIGSFLWERKNILHTNYITFANI